MTIPSPERLLELGQVIADAGENGSADPGLAQRWEKALGQALDTARAEDYFECLALHPHVMGWPHAGWLSVNTAELDKAVRDGDIERIKDLRSDRWYVQCHYTTMGFDSKTAMDIDLILDRQGD